MVKLSKLTGIAAWVALLAPLFYILPGWLSNGKKLTDDAKSRSKVWASIVVAIASLGAAVAAFGTLRRAPLAAVVTMMVGVVATMVSSTLMAVAGMAHVPPALLGVIMYAMPLAMGATLGSSAAAGASIAAELGATASWARLLAALAVAAVSMPLAIKIDRSNPMYPIATAATSRILGMFTQKKSTPAPPPRTPPPTTT